LAKILIEGGRRLSGEFTASGSKNGALAIIAASLLVEGEVVLRRVPHIKDIFTMLDILHYLGAKAELSEDGTLTINASTIVRNEAPPELVKKMRASFSVLGPLLARTGRARVAVPGGCDIGARPIDLHLKGIHALGALVRNDYGHVEAKASRLRGARIYLDFPSAGATQQIMMAACLSEGTTIIEQAACEPEITDLALFLRKCGVRIEGAGTGMIQVEGVRHLTGVEHEIIPDRVEVGTFALAAANTRGDIFIRNAVPEHCSAVLQKMREIGAIVHEDAAGLRVTANRRFVATDIVTMPFPGFPTDLQQPMGAVLTTAEGTSIITEKVYEHRFRYLSELKRMGADVYTENRVAVIRGVPYLQGAQVTATDLRAGAALAIAALGAEGVTEISEVEHIQRGYENFEEKLRALGASVLSGEALPCSQ